MRQEHHAQPFCGTATSEGEAGSAGFPAHIGHIWKARLGNTHNTHRAHGPNHLSVATKQERKQC